MKDKIFDVPFVRGVSVVVPKERVCLEDLASEMDIEESSLKNIIKLSGVHETRKSDADKTISDYCIRAAENLFSDLNFDKSQIDGIVFVTTSPDYIQPGSGFVVHDHFNFREDCPIIDINQACTGYVYGLFQSFMMVQSGYCKNVLLCVGDTPTKTIHPRDKSLRMVNGDAGTATIVSAGEYSRLSCFSFLDDSKKIKSLYIPAGGSRMPRKYGVTDVEEVDDQGNVRTLENNYMNGLDMMAFTVGVAPKAIRKVLEIMAWQKDDVDYFFLHQANKLIIDAIRKRLKVSPEKVPIHLEKYGNVSCATIPVALCEENCHERKLLNRVVLCAFGAGLSCAAMALDLKNTHFCELREM